MLHFFGLCVLGFYCITAYCSPDDANKAPLKSRISDFRSLGPFSENEGRPKRKKQENISSSNQSRFLLNESRIPPQSFSMSIASQAPSLAYPQPSEPLDIPPFCPIDSRIPDLPALIPIRSEDPDLIAPDIHAPIRIEDTSLNPLNLPFFPIPGSFPLPFFAPFLPGMNSYIPQISSPLMSQGILNPLNPIMLFRPAYPYRPHPMPMPMPMPMADGLSNMSFLGSHLQSSSLTTPSAPTQSFTVPTESSTLVLENPSSALIASLVLTSSKPHQSPSAINKKECAPKTPLSSEKISFFKPPCACGSTAHQRKTATDCILRRTLPNFRESTINNFQKYWFGITLREGKTVIEKDPLRAFSEGGAVIDGYGMLAYEPKSPELKEILKKTFKKMNDKVGESDRE